MYQARAIRLIGYTREGRTVEPATDPGTALPGQARVLAESIAHQSDTNDWLVPFPDAWNKGAPIARPPAPGPSQHFSATDLRCIGTFVARQPQSAADLLDKPGYHLDRVCQFLRGQFLD